MGLSHAPRVITDGLVLGLDAANTRSYGGSGTTWTDLIGSNNGTLTNGPVFTQEPKLEPFGGAGAVEFDGTGDYLSIANSADFDFGTGDFTIEAWIYPDSGSTNGSIITKRSSSAYFAPFLLRNVNTTSLQFLMSTSGSSWNFNQTAASALTTDAWQHVAVTRSGTAIKAFVNGTEVISSTLSGALMTNTQTVVIGTDFAYYLDGKISNLRVIKGTALYTSNFTPPRKKLEATSDTVLLTCEKGTIKDRSPSAHAITINGDAKSISGASYFEFDGTNDYVNAPVTKAASCTFSCWAKTTTLSGTPMLFNAGPSGSGPDLFFYNSKISWNTWDSDSNSFASTPASATDGNWHYYVVVNDASSNAKLYYDGELLGTATYKNASANTNLTIGGNTDTYQWNGSISNFMLHNKVLTAAEVEQNYNSLRGRYGI